MIHVHSLVWELSNVEITRELTGSGGSKSTHHDEKGTAGSKYKDLSAKDAAEDSTGSRKDDWLLFYQTILSGGTLFFFLNSDSDFLEGYTNSE